MRPSISPATAFLSAIASALILSGSAAAQDRLPDGGISEGMGLRAWYAAPTDRYGHGILGDAIEAGSLIIELDGETLRYDLPKDSVFEDLTPRIVDANGDGTPEVLTIKSYLRSGATIVLFGIEDGEVISLAEAPAIGTAYRWLNPAGVADYDGDGKVEIAVIETPHIGGDLILYHWDGISDQIAEERRVSGYSTHAIGSRALNLALSEDWNGDGVTDLLLPNQARDTLIAVDMTQGGFDEIDRYKMRREITGDLALMGNFVQVPLRGNQTRTITRPYPDGK